MHIPIKGRYQYKKRGYTCMKTNKVSYKKKH